MLPTLRSYGTMKHIVEHLLPKGKTGIFLMVDDLAQAGGNGTTGPEQSIVEAIEHLLDIMSETEFGVLMTTTHVGPIMDAVANSRRNVNWVTLRPLTPDEAIPLLASEDHQKGMTQCLAMLTGGHLPTLANTFNTKANWINIPLSSITLEHIQQWANLWEEYHPSQDLVMAALKGQVCILENQIGDWKLSEWIKLGVCHQPIRGARHDYVPTLPLLCLYHNMNHLGMRQLTDLLTHCVPPHASQRKVGEATPHRILERFHIYWENLRRSLLSNEITLPEFYGLEFAVDGSGHSLHFSLYLRGLHLVPKLGVNELTTSLSSFLEEVDPREAWFYLCGTDTNHPIHAFYFEILPGNQLLFVGINNHDTEGWHEKVDTLKSILFPNKTTERCYEVSSEKYTLLEKNVVVVFASLQSVPTNPDEWPPNVIVLVRERLEKLYSPTLMPIIKLWLSHPEDFNDC